MTRKNWPLLTFDELAVGDEWESPRRTVTEADVVLFAGLTGDYTSLHVDHEAAKEGPFGRPVAHGLLVLTISTGLITQCMKVDTLAFLGIAEWKFLRPIYFGDTIHSICTVAALEPKARGRRGVVTWSRRVLNQEGEVVQEGTSQTLVRGKTSAEKGRPE